MVQAAEVASSSTTGTPVEPIEAVVKESGGSESQEQEVRSSDPCKKETDACEEVTFVDVPEKSPVVEAEGQPFVSLMSLGNSLIDVEKKTKANGGSTGLNRGKKRQSKANVGVAWGKLLSQCPQVALSVQSQDRRGCIFMFLGLGSVWKRVLKVIMLRQIITI
ncbi:hypothetical protein Hdeb2414_s0033g00720721 [Helianthus debilis subsp. tardiflorus]